MISYLEKHQPEIINYNRRSRSGKTIGSGQGEKGVDLTIGSRQKHRGMSWRPKGSKALCQYTHNIAEGQAYTSNFFRQSACF